MVDPRPHDAAALRLPDLDHAPGHELEMALRHRVTWTVRKRGFGPIYQCRPLRACWIAEDEDGMVDTLFFQFTLPIWKAVARWPDHGVEVDRAMADDDPARPRRP
jgi:hypothetical protein